MYLDILIAVILLMTVIKGYLNGFFIEVLSFFGMIINLIFTKNLTPILILNFSIKPENPFYSGVYAILFLGIYTVMGMFIMFIKKALKKAFKGKLNTMAGSILGLFKGLLIAFVIMVFYSLLSMNLDFIKKYGEESYSQKVFISSLPVLREYFPDEYGERLQNMAHREKVEEYLKNILKE
ncbi:CvpA family protein [uncultured Ilyobacter sp.]|uniref:CvpA family protein n=1 Tax=uncultured Ilyobacter sp. TaxID=544433 RepID=UPI0029C0CB3C|nr:CvpA family protein [uncultured Ilyobacter sp.]